MSQEILDGILALLASAAVLGIIKYLADRISKLNMADSKEKHGTP